jgi:hypothetical protein
LAKDRWVRQWPAIDPQTKIPDLHFIVAHRDEPLDKITPQIIRGVENNQIPPLGGSKSRKPPAYEWDGNPIDNLVDKDPIPLHQGGTHRATWNLKGLKKKRPNHKGKEDRNNKRFQGLS